MKKTSFPKKHARPPPTLNKIKLHPSQTKKNTNQAFIVRCFRAFAGSNADIWHRVYITLLGIVRAAPPSLFRSKYTLALTVIMVPSLLKNDLLFFFCKNTFICNSETVIFLIGNPLKMNPNKSCPKLKKRKPLKVNREVWH